MDTMVSLKGVLKEPVGEFKFVEQKLTVRHETDFELRKVIDALMQDAQRTQGLVVVVDETTLQSDPTNLRFWPMSNFLYVGIEIRKLTIPMNRDGKEPIN